MALQASGQDKNPYLRANSLDELCNWDDVDFVRCAYVTILGRQPDKSGELHFTKRLRMGDSKYSILWQLRRSEEGPDHDPGIAGLDRTLRRAAWARNPLLGWLLRPLTRAFEGNSARDRQFRALMNSMALARADLHGLHHLLQSLRQNTQHSGDAAALKDSGAGDPVRASESKVRTVPPELARLAIRTPLPLYFINRGR